MVREASTGTVQNALTVFVRDKYPLDWASVQNNLGVIYKNLETNKAKNVEKAIRLFDDALEVRTHEKYPELWAETQVNLGNAYGDRIEGDQNRNEQIAIETYEKTIEVFKQLEDPNNWAKVQNNLGGIYLDKVMRGEEEVNAEKAILAFNSVLKTFDVRTNPVEYINAKIG